jgi:hypothetical protein
MSASNNNIELTIYNIKIIRTQGGLSTDICAKKTNNELDGPLMIYNK